MLWAQRPDESGDADHSSRQLPPHFVGAVEQLGGRSCTAPEVPLDEQRVRGDGLLVLLAVDVAAGVVAAVIIG